MMMEQDELQDGTGNKKRHCRKVDRGLYYQESGMNGHWQEERTTLVQSRKNKLKKSKILVLRT